MADTPHPLPEPRTPPPFAALEADLEIALRRGRQRRARTSSAAGAALLVVPAVLFAALSVGQPREDSLSIADRPTPSPTATGSALPRPTASRPSVLPEANPTDGQEPTQPSAGASGAASPLPTEPEELGRTGSPVPTAPSGTPQAPPQPVPGPGQPGPAQTRPSAAAPERGFPVTRDVVAYTAESCQYSPGTGAAAGWCVGSPGPFTTRQGQPVALRQLLCRVPASGAREAQFPRDREVEFVVYGGQPERRWTSATGDHARPHSVTVQAGTCVRWTVTWDARDDGGTVLPPGEYTFEPHVDADLSGINQSEAYRFPYDFTVME